MRYKRKKAEKEMIEYYEFCKEMYVNCLKQNKEYAANNYLGKMMGIEMIFKIAKENGYKRRKNDKADI